MLCASLGFHPSDSSEIVRWNDEGETQYETYHLWNLAHAEALAKHDPTKRLFTLNRAFTPGLARLGAALW